MFPVADSGSAILVIASASPRRRDLIATLDLASQGIDVVAEPADLDESIIGVRSMPDERVVAIAMAKAKAVFEHATTAHRNLSGVLGADTMVVIGGETLGKPVDAADQRAMLASASNQTIEVVTGLVLIRPDETLQSAAVSTAVDLRSLRVDEIDDYITSGAGDDKAGALELQGAALPFVAAVDGCWTNVIGLPMCQVDLMLGGAAAVCDGQHAAPNCQRPEALR